MRFMAIVKASPESESGDLPKAEMLETMGKFNEEMARAGVMLAAEGLQASSKGARIHYTASAPTVIDGPFAETKELVGGFWMIQVRSKEEAIEWISRAPMPPGAQVEIRQVFEAADFGLEEFPLEAQAREQKLRDELQAKHGVNLG